MANAARRVGSTFETDVVAFARERGYSAERLPRAGRFDEGDLSLTAGGHLYVCELKARRDRNSSLNLGSWLGEAHRESANYATARALPEHPTPILIVKNPGKSIGKAFVVQYLEDWINEHPA